MRSAALLLLPLVVCTSCSYLKNRTNDLLDVVRFGGGVGPGLHAELRVTDFAATGLGFRDQSVAGLHGRFVYTGADAQGIGLGLFLLRGFFPWHAAPLLPGDPSTFDSLTEIDAQFFVFFPLDSPRGGGYRLADRGVHVADVGAGIALGYVGVDIGVSPGEFADLLFGFFGIDLASDDVFGDEPRTAEKVPVELPLYTLPAEDDTPPGGDR